MTGLMNNQFINQTLKVLKYTNLSIPFPEICDVTMQGDKRNMHFTLEGASGGIRIRDNFILQVMIFFGLIDAYVDIRYPELEGKSFLDKCRNLPIADDSGIMTRKIYRLLRILRNAAVHSRIAISVDEIDIHATARDSELHLRIVGLELIYAFVMLLLRESNMSDEYQTSLLRTYYDEILQAIILLRDKIDNDCQNISTSPRLKRGARYRVQNPVFQVDADTQSLRIKKYVINQHETKYADFDYIVNMNNLSFLIPNEILDESGKIALEELTKWTYK